MENSIPEQQLTAPTNIVAYLNEANLIFRDELANISSNVDSLTFDSQDAVSETKQRNSIFVCTFCQVFSISSSAIAKHINKEHGKCLKEGTIPENYVSKLQALKSATESKARKLGRPKKVVKDCIPSVTINKKVSSPDPVLSPDGFYWCLNCHKNFKKARQFSRHVCFDNDSQDDSVEETNDDDTADFRTYINIQQEPWTRKRKRKIRNEKMCHFPQEICSLEDKNSEEKIDFQQDIGKHLLKWKDDPNYVPTFNNEGDKEEFAKYLKSIDYKFVDNLIEKISNKPKFWKKDSAHNTSSSRYSCICCNKIFGSLSHARLHCLTHTDLKPFACPKCPYRTNIKAGLHSHMRSHTGNLFSCTHCSFQSHKRSHLVDHEQTHSTVRQGCKLCKNSYKTLRSLKFHVKRYHDNANGKRYLKTLNVKALNKTTFKCDICAKSFTSHSKLVFHKQNHHIIIPSSDQVEKQLECQVPMEMGDSFIATLQNPSELVNENAFIQILVNPPELIVEDSLNKTLVSASELIESSLNERLGNSSELMVKNTFNDTIVNSPELMAENSFNEIGNSAALVGENSLVEILDSPSRMAAENSFENIDLIDLQNMPLQDCIVRLKPLDDQIINHHQYNIECNACDQKFTSDSLLDDHRHLDHSMPAASNHVNKEIDESYEDTQVLNSLLECSVRIEPLDEHLVELMLNNILQDKGNQSSELFDDVFQQSPNLLMPNGMLDKTLSTKRTPEKLLSVNNMNQYQLSDTSILEKCQKDLGIDILDECLRQSDISEGVSGTSYQTSGCDLPSNDHHRSSAFNLPVLNLNFSSNELMTENISEKDILQLESELGEPKSEEIKLFEKCKRAPAYVCCVCSGIFICPSTLKAHLKEHVDKSNSFVGNTVENFPLSKLTADKSTLDSVCRMLEESPGGSVENELEKLYTSSLHRMWYLPEVSVVLENDQSLTDTFLEDISNFPINDGLDTEIFS